MNIEHLISSYHNFEANLYANESRSGLLAPVEYIMSLKSKRIRPLLTLIGFSLYNDKVQSCLHAAHGLELFHNFTLMHDDIMDQAELRRGKLATHLRYGINEAIISGDAMSIMSYEYIMKDCPDDQLRTILQLFNKTAIDICIGQQMDMEFEKIDVVNSEDYLEMVRLKTAIFLGLALQIGSLIAGSTFKESELLFKYGESIGLTFQIQDDLLDLYGNQNDIGKINGGDILRNKKTILVCKANELCNSDQKESLRQLLNENDISSEKKIEEALTIFQSINLQDVIESEIEKYFSLAKAQLNELALNKDQLNLLENIAQMIQARKS